MNEQPDGARRWEKVFKLFYISFATLALVCFGLVVSGKTAVANNIYNSMQTANFPIQPMEYSKVGTVSSQDGLSGLHWSLPCEVNATVSSVIEHYSEIALKNAIIGPDGKRFLVHSQGPGVQSLVWIDASQQRLGVVAMRHISDQSTRYHLFRANKAANVDPAAIKALPMGLAAPKDSVSYFDFRNSAKSYGYFRTPREPGSVFRELTQNAENQGLSCHEAGDVLDVHERESGIRSLTVTDGQSKAVYTVSKVGSGQTEVMYMVSDKQ